MREYQESRDPIDSLLEVGRYFGIKGSTVSEILKAVEHRMEKDAMFGRDIHKLRGMIIEK